MAAEKFMALLLLLLPVHVIAQTSEFISFLEDKVLGYKEIEADFTMIRTVPMIKGQLVSKGNMIVKDKDCFEWHVTEGERYDMEVSGGVATIREDGRENVIDMASSPVYSRVMKMMDMFSRRPFYKDQRSFRTTFSHSGQGMIKIETVPLRAGMSAFVSKISAVARESDGAIEEINLFLANGAVTRIVFNDVKILR